MALFKEGIETFWKVQIMFLKVTIFIQMFWNEISELVDSLYNKLLEIFLMLSVERMDKSELQRHRWGHVGNH